MPAEKIILAPTAPALDTADGPLSEIVAVALNSEFAYVPGLSWLSYTGKVWAEVGDETVIEAVRQELKLLLQAEIEARADPKRLVALKVLLGISKIRNVAVLLKGMLTVPASEFDARNDLLNVSNGVVDLRTRKLLPHKPEYRFTKITRAAYKPDATSVYWNRALRALTPSARTWMQIRLGQALTGYTPSDDVLVVSKGTGANGKSTLFDGVRFACGSFAGIVPDRILTSRDGDHPTELTTLRGLRLAFLEELPEGGRLNVKRLKDIVGTESITARKIRENNITWTATHGLFITTNYSPRVNESDHGTWRRLALVRFPYTFRKPGQPLKSKLDREGDPTLRDRMRNARVQSAILAWLVEGASTWYAADKTMPLAPAGIVRDTESWRAQTDLILGFARERLAWDPTRSLLASDLMEQFNTWLGKSGHPEWGAQLLAERFGSHVLVQEQNVTKRRARPKAGQVSHPYAITGIRVRQASDAAPSGPVYQWFGVAWATDTDAGEDEQ